jgi:hypothetical protein
MQQNFDIGPAFKTLTIIYMALGMGMILSTGVFYFLIESGNGPTQNAELVQVFTIVVPVIAVSCIGAGRFLYNKGAEKSRNEMDIQKKFALFQSHNLIVWAMLEGPALFSVIAYWLTGDPLFLVFFAMIFAVFIFSKPSISKFQQEF